MVVFQAQLEKKYDDNAVVPGITGDTWNTPTVTSSGIIPKNFYVDVLATSCRTCHNSRTRQDLWFDRPSKLSGSGANFVVCGTQILCLIHKEHI